MNFTARLTLVCLVTVPFATFGHARWTNPTPRSPSAGIKTSPPCGNLGTRRANVTTFNAGGTVQLNWEETIDHRGRWEILFSPMNDQNFTHLPLAGGGMTDNINDPNDNPGARSAMVVLPSTPCNDCTLQLIQQMYQGTDLPDGGNTTIIPYFSCADIALIGPPNDGGMGGQDSGAPPDAGAGGGGGSGGGAGGGGGGNPTGEQDAGSTNSGGGGGNPAEEDNRIIGGCGSSATGSAALGGIIALVASLGAIRRRRRSDDK